jgi:hypothetical protein
MNIFKINFVNLVGIAKKAYENKEDYNPQLYDSFLDHTIPILASYPLKNNTNGKISAKLTLENLPSSIETINGKFDYPKQLIQFLYYVKRAHFINGAQNKASRLASLTPLLMYAQKLHNGITYDKWDQNDPLIHWILGRGLEDILKDIARYKDIGFDGSNIDYQLLRKAALTQKSGKKAGSMHPIDRFNCNIRKINGQLLEKMSIRMILQLWLANPACRNTDSMILDPFDWAKIPKPLDQMPVFNSQPQKNIDDDIPWI